MVHCVDAGEMLCLGSMLTPASFVMLIKATGTVFLFKSENAREKENEHGGMVTLPVTYSPSSILFFNVTRCAQQKRATIS